MARGIVYDSYFQPYELRNDLFSQHRLGYLYLTTLILS